MYDSLKQFNYAEILNKKSQKRRKTVFFRVILNFYNIWLNEPAVNLPPYKVKVTENHKMMQFLFRCFISYCFFLFFNQYRYGVGDCFINLRGRQFRTKEEPAVPRQHIKDNNYFRLFLPDGQYVCIKRLPFLFLEYHGLEISNQTNDVDGPNYRNFA